MTTLELSHNGIAVSISSSGKFEAKVGKEIIRAPSFDAIKKKLNKLGSFPAFKGITHDYRGYNPVNIVALKRSGVRGYRNGEMLFVDDKGGSHHRVIEDTPENAALIVEITAERAQFEKLEKAHDEKIRQLRAKLTERVAAREVVS